MLALLALALLNEAALRQAIAKGTGTVQLPPGTITISTEIVLPHGWHDLEIRGEGTVLRAADDFKGRALLVAKGGRGLRLEGFTVDGNRGKLEKPLALTGYHPFRDFFVNNGLLIEDAENVAIVRLAFRQVVSFPILVSAAKNVTLGQVTVEDSGSRDPSGHHNTTGGILLEAGTAGFTVTGCTLRRVRGNGIWTHSYDYQPRNSDGRIENNEFEEVAGDAIQVGHATRVRVLNNRGRRIGYPVGEVGADPVALDTAGDTDLSAYTGNRFEEVNGKCIDLDGFHHGEVRGNTCINRGPRAAYPRGQFGIVFNNTYPGVKTEEVVVEDNTIDGAVYGGIFVIGSHHRIAGNRMLRLNLAECVPGKAGCIYWPDEPALLSSGIYLGRHGTRPTITTGDTVSGNTVSGYGMDRRCVVTGQGVPRAANRIGPNRCVAGASK